MFRTSRLKYDDAIDADGHINEPADLWEKYLETQYVDRAIRIRPGPDGLDHLELNGQRSRYFGAEILARGRSMGTDAKERSNGNQKRLIRTSRWLTVERITAGSLISVRIQVTGSSLLPISR